MTKDNATQDILNKVIKNDFVLYIVDRLTKENLDDGILGMIDDYLTELGITESKIEVIRYNKRSSR